MRTPTCVTERTVSRKPVTGHFAGMSVRIGLHIDVQEVLPGARFAHYREKSTGTDVKVGGFE